MGIVTSFDVRYHQQDRDTFCGPDTAMMILNFLQPGEPPLAQSSLRGMIAATNDSNATPDGVAAALEANKPQPPTVSFAAEEFDQLSDANAAIVRALFDSGTPVAAEIHGGFHWAVVCGALTDVAPAPGVAHQLQGFFLDNPTLPPVAGAQQHRDDDLCGRAPYRGFLHEFVSATGWARTFRPNRHGKFVCVAASDGAVEASAEETLLQPPADPTVALDPLQRAMDGIAFFQLSSQGPLQELLTGAVATASVHVGGTQPAFYVTMTQKGQNVGFARVTDDDGTLLGVAVTDPGQLHPILTPLEIVRRLTVAGFVLDEERIQLRADEFEVGEPIWRPCREAPSPYYALYEIRMTGEYAFQTIFATTEGRPHAALTFFDEDRLCDEPAAR